MKNALDRLKKIESEIKSKGSPFVELTYNDGTKETVDFCKVFSIIKEDKRKITDAYFLNDKCNGILPDIIVYLSNSNE